MPLARHLPPASPASAAAWLHHHNFTPGSWVVDPIGSTPSLALELARAGLRVLVTCNNPVLCFILETLAGAPHDRDFRPALASLALVRHGSQRLDVHLQSLYQTTCPACGQTVQARGYVWKREGAQPESVLVDCPLCGKNTEHPPTPDDLERLKSMGREELHRSLALQRAAGEDDSTRQGAQEAINAYLLRPIYFLITLLNRLGGGAIPEEYRRLLQALLLECCDLGNSLWAWPVTRARPRQMLTPPQFRENNLWLALAETIPLWCGQEDPVPLTRWPILPPEGGGICLHPGRLKSLLPLPDDLHLLAAISVLPRPSQAFWTLSALWTAWLWGKSAAHPLRGALLRERYDWNWHARALQATFSAIQSCNPTGLPFFALLPQIAPGFLAASLTAASAAGLRLESLAIREDDETAQALWVTASHQMSPSFATMDSICRDAIVEHFQQRNEPATYLPLFAACLSALEKEHHLAARGERIAHNAVGQLQSAFGRSLASPDLLIRDQVDSRNDEIGLWWLSSQVIQEPLPITDRVEEFIVSYLQQHPGCTFSQIDSAVCEELPGLFTPSSGMVRAVLESYGETSAAAPDLWRLAKREQESERQSDLRNTIQMLFLTGTRLGFQVFEAGESIHWKTATGKIAWIFYPILSSIIHRIVFTPPASLTAQRVIVLPGSRCNLLTLKLQSDPRLARAARGFHYLKFRQLRAISAQVEITPARWEEYLDSDPPRPDEATQMKMFTD